MDRNEFIKKLKEALINSLDKESVDSQLDYYDKYISDEISKGRSEKEVLDELGDPNLIAKTIKTVTGTENVVDAGESTSSSGNTNKNQNQNKQRSTYTYVGGSRSIIGCAIVGLLMFIVVMAVLRFFGVLVLGTAGMAFGFGPFSIILIIILINLMFRGGRR